MNNAALLQLQLELDQEQLKKKCRKKMVSVLNHKKDE